MEINIMKFWKSKKAIEKKASATGAVVSMYNVGQPVWMGRDYEKFAKEAYQENVIANRCVSLIAKGVASLQWQVVAGDTLLEKHPLLDLLKKPNETQAQCDFFEAVISYKLLSGNSYIEAAYPNAGLAPRKTPPTYLYSLRPDRMQIIKGKKGLAAAYQYEVNSSKVVFPVSVSGISNILHVKNFHPTDDWYGLANVEPGAFSIDQHNSASAWNQSLLQNGARPSGALMVEGVKGQSAELSDDQYQRLKENLEENMSGPTNSGKPLLLEGGLKWVEMSMNPKDMDWLEGKHSVARDIALAFGVPSQLLGIPGDNTYSNMQEARLTLWEQTILPAADELVAHLNSWLVPRYGDGLTLKYNRENIDALRIKRELQRASLEPVTYMTSNEKRKAIGLDPIDGGDELLIDANKIPISFAGQVAEPVPQDSAKQLFIKKLQEIGFEDSEIKQMVLEEYATTNKSRDSDA